MWHEVLILRKEIVGARVPDLLVARTVGSSERDILVTIRKFTLFHNVWGGGCICESKHF